MRQWIRSGVGVVVLSLLTVSGSTAQDVGLPLGTQAPAAALEDLDGTAVELLD